MTKFLHTSPVEKHGTVGIDLQRGGELEGKAPEEETKQEDGFP